MTTYDYTYLKNLAKELKISVTSVCALAPKNDPFYCGSRGQQAKGHWFTDLWNQFGYDRGVHLRRVHYQLVSQSPPVQRPDGKPYENTTSSWAYLLEAGKAARYLGLVSVEAFVDRRNPEPILNAPWTHTQPPGFYVPSWDTFELQLPEWPDLPTVNIDGYEPTQDYHLEIWVEKTTMNDILEPICRDYNINLVTGAGELSITAANNAINRIHRADLPAVIFYIADFDPAGYGMPVSIARKIEYLLQQAYFDATVTLQPIALTLAQVRDYELPRSPIKPTELRRARFETTFGSGAVELDALEALHPGLLAEIVRKHVLRYHDESLDDRTAQAKADFREALDWQRALSLIPYAHTLVDLEDQFADAVQQFANTIAPINAQLDHHIVLIQEDLRNLPTDPEDHPQPYPEGLSEYTDPLFSTTRDYLDQLRHYKSYRNGIVS